MRRRDLEAYPLGEEPGEGLVTAQEAAIGLVVDVEGVLIAACLVLVLLALWELRRWLYSGR